MRKDDRGLAPNGGTLLHDAADAASGAAARHQAAGAREAAPVIATTEGGSTIAKPSGGTAEPVARSEPGGGAGKPPAVPASAGTRLGAADAENDTEVPAAVAVRTSGVVARPAAGAPEPSWAQVLATTIRLWVSRRLRRIGIGPRRPPHPGAGKSRGEPSARTRSRSVWRWRLVAIVLAVVILALVALQLSGVLNRPGSPGIRKGTGGQLRQWRRVIVVGGGRGA